MLDNFTRSCPMNVVRQKRGNFVYSRCVDFNFLGIFMYQVTAEQTISVGIFC